MTPTPDQTPESSPGFKAAKALREAGYLSSHYSNTHQLFTEAGKIIEASFVESSEELTNLRATNATLAERVRRLEEALTALSNSANAAAEWCNTSMMDDEIMHAESILTDSASPDPVLPIKLAFCSLHQAWLVAHHRSCMNETMDALAVVLGLDPMNPNKGLPTPGAAVGKEGE